MATATSTGTSFTLTEEGGGVLTLTGRALPYLPLSITGKQRAEFTWYPGSPSATVQMLGPEEGAITIRGYWKDKFLAGSKDATLSTGPRSFQIGAQIGIDTPGYTVTGSGLAGIQTCVELVRIVDTMRRMGRRITLAWDSIVRHGHITSFTQTWYTPGYCEWEMEFSVAAQEAGPVSAVSSKPAITLESAAVQTTSEAAAVTNALQTLTSASPATVSGIPRAAQPAGAAPSAPGTLPPVDLVGGTQAPAVLTPTITDKLGEIEAQIMGVVDQINGYAQQAVSAVNAVNEVISAPANITRKAVGSLVQSYTSLANSVGQVANTAVSYWFSFAEVFGGQDAVPIGYQMGAMSIKRGVTDAYYGFMRSNVATSILLETQLQQDLQSTYIATLQQDQSHLSPTETIQWPTADS